MKADCWDVCGIVLVHMNTPVSKHAKISAFKCGHYWVMYYTLLITYLITLWRK